ncbi:MAG: biopolymer transporter ExbD [Alphaproteobacteria bacterium]|nr:biopolymer transporter ExbD [Alphaproteobacteria bacterium]
MRRLRQRKDGDGSIDISPLIDVVFILLIFFMVTTTFVKDMKLDLERPSARSSSRASTKAIRVYVDSGERVYIDELPVKPWMVESRVRELLAGQDEPTVLVVTDRRVPAQTLIEVVDRCRLAGAQNVGVITSQEEG